MPQSHWRIVRLYKKFRVELEHNYDMCVQMDNEIDAYGVCEFINEYRCCCMSHSSFHSFIIYQRGLVNAVHTAHLAALRSTLIMGTNKLQRL